VFNQPSTQEIYEKITKIFFSGTDEEKEGLWEQREKMKVQQGTYKHIRNSENVSGDYIYRSSNIIHSYEIDDAHDVKYSRHVWFNAGDCMDVDTV